MIRRFAIRGWVVISLCLAAALVSPVEAELKALYDTGKTRSLLPLYLRAFNLDRSKGASPKAPFPSAAAFSLGDMLPVRSEGLTPGPVRPRGLPRPIPIHQPIFLVGSDERSLRWLQKHRARLQALNAVGLIVEAETIEALHVIAAAGQGLRISLGAAGDLARALGLAHYPVLISRDGLEQ